MMEFYLAHGASQIRASFKDSFKIDHPEKKYEGFWTHKMNVSKDKMGWLITLDEKYDVGVFKSIKKEDGSFENLKVRLKVDDFRKWLHGKLDPFSDNEKQQQKQTSNNQERVESHVPRSTDDSLPF